MAVIGSTMAVASLIALAPATTTFASGKPLNCVTTSVQSYPGITKAGTFSADPAGTVRLKRNLTVDGLDVGKVVLNPGWTKSVETKSGPKVTIKFQNGSDIREWEAAQSAAYYGPDILVVEMKTCTKA